MDKIVSGYQTVYGSQLDEDAVLSKCRNAVSFVQKVDKEIGGDIESGNWGQSFMINHYNLNSLIFLYFVNFLRCSM